MVFLVTDRPHVYIQNPQYALSVHPLFTQPSPLFCRLWGYRQCLKTLKPGENCHAGGSVGVAFSEGLDPQVPVEGSGEPRRPKPGYRGLSNA